MRNKLEVLRDAFRWYNLPPDRQYDNLNQAERYDEAARQLTDREGFADFLIERIGKNPGKTLEIAAGTGLISQKLHKAGIDICFTDLSLPALEILKGRVEGQSRVVQANFHNLPFRDDVFETVVLIGAYRYTENRDQFWEETQRVLKPGGRIVVAQFYPRGSSLHGNDINVDKTVVDHGVSFQGGAEYEAKVDVFRGVKVKSGKYLLFNFTSKK